MGWSVFDLTPPGDRCQSYAQVSKRHHRAGLSFSDRTDHTLSPFLCCGVLRKGSILRNGREGGTKIGSHCGCLFFPLLSIRLYPGFNTCGTALRAKSSKCSANRGSALSTDLDVPSRSCLQTRLRHPVAGLTMESHLDCAPTS